MQVTEKTVVLDILKRRGFLKINQNENFCRHWFIIKSLDRPCHRCLPQSIFLPTIQFHNQREIQEDLKGKSHYPLSKKEQANVFCGNLVKQFERLTKSKKQMVKAKQEAFHVTTRK